MAKTYIDFADLQSVGSTRRKCKFICERCHKSSTMAVDRLLMKEKLLCHQCSKELTCIEKYGKPIPYQNESIRLKGQQTCMKNHGVLFGGQTEKSRELARARFKDKYVRDKIKQSCLAKFGVDSYAKTKMFHDYMHALFQDEKFVKIRTVKCKKTKLGLHGNENYCNIKKIEKTCMERYGTKNPMCDPVILAKMQATIKERYGVDNISQLPSHMTTKRCVFDGYSFDSTWELDFYRFLKACGKYNFIVHPKIIFKYSYNGKEHIYHPDFIVGNRIVEIKGDHFFNEKGWLCNPFNRNQDELFRAKHECMIKNNVIILKKHDLEEIIRNERIEWLSDI